MKVNTVDLYNNGPMVRPYALMYGSHMLPNLFKILSQRTMWLLYILEHMEAIYIVWDTKAMCRGSLSAFSTDSEA